MVSHRLSSVGRNRRSPTVASPLNALAFRQVIETWEDKVKRLFEDKSDRDNRDTAKADLASLLDDLLNSCRLAEEERTALDSKLPGLAELIVSRTAGNTKFVSLDTHVFARVFEGLVKRADQSIRPPLASTKVESVQCLSDQELILKGPRSLSIFAMGLLLLASADKFLRPDSGIQQDYTVLDQFIDSPWSKRRALLKEYLSGEQLATFNKIYMDASKELGFPNVCGI